MLREQNARNSDVGRRRRAAETPLAASISGRARMRSQGRPAAVRWIFRCARSVAVGRARIVCKRGSRTDEAALPVLR